MKTTNVKFAEYIVDRRSTECFDEFQSRVCSSVLANDDCSAWTQCIARFLHVGADGTNKYGPNADRDHKCKHKNSVKRHVTRHK